MLEDIFFGKLLANQKTDSLTPHPKCLVKKLPWGSLALLLFTYIIFGWLLYTWSASWHIWLIGAALVLLIALALTAPLKILSICFGSLLKSDSQAFITIITMAFVAVVLLRWFPIFVHFLVLLSAASLARLDIQIAGFTGLQAFWILAVVSLVGFCLGLLIHQQLIIHRLF